MPHPARRARHDAGSCRSGNGNRGTRALRPAGTWRQVNLWSRERSAKREETGVLIDPADLAFSHVVRYRSPEGQARIGFFFTVVRWQGTPANLEPHKCAGWAHPARTPANTVPYTAAALAAITSGATFSLDGW
jgi:hypothetical protein